MTTRKQLIAAIAVAALLWCYMFSPWTAGLTNFWLTMAGAAVILTTLALRFSPRPLLPRTGHPLLQLLTGLGIALALWGVFWVGDKVSSMLFDFARPGVDAVYAMKHGLPDAAIALLLLLVIGPAEELFWRGFVQRRMAALCHSRRPDDAAFAVTTVIYALVHVWSFNFMLVAAAFTAGFIWGLLYRWRPELLPALVVSHAVWDALVFVVWPIM